MTKNPFSLFLKRFFFSIQELSKLCCLIMVAIADHKCQLATDNLLLLRQFQWQFNITFNSSMDGWANDCGYRN